MTFLRPAALAAAALIALACVACTKPKSEPKLDAALFATHAQSIAFVTGSLCTGGDASFDCQASKVLTRIATSRFKAAAELSEGQIDVGTAVAAQVAADRVRSGIDIAIAECKVSGQTGECTSNSNDAHQRLQQAQAAVVSLK